MTCTLIIIGHDPNYRLRLDAIDGPANFVIGQNSEISAVALACPGCENGKSVTVSSAPAATTQYTTCSSSTWPDKPAETYILSMTSALDAESWITRNASQLVGKTLLIIDQPLRAQAP